MKFLCIFAVAGCVAFSCAGADTIPLAFDAIRNDKQAVLKSLGDSDISARDGKGTTPLMYAAAFGSPGAMKLLLEKGASVNARNDFDATALLWAACDDAKATLLLEHRAEVKVQSKQGRTPLMIAASCGKAATAAQFLAKGADLRLADSQGVTALHLAVQSGDIATIRLLVEKGADVNALDKRGDGPLLAAATNGSLDAIRLLLSKGARVNAARMAYPQVKHGQIALVGVTPLIAAAPYGSPEVIQTLLDAGADVNARENRDMTALMFAVASEKQNPAVVRILLKAGASASAKSNVGETALDWAVKFGNPETIAILKAAGESGGGQAQAAASQTHAAAGPTDLVSPRPALEAMAQSVMLLQRSSTEFFRQSGCIGCHHQPATAAAVHSARKAGIKIDEAAAKEQAGMLRLGWGVSVDDMLQGIRRGGGSDRISNQLLGLWASGLEPDATTDAALADLVSLQTPGGSWSEREPRAPLAEGDIARTAWAVRAIKIFGWSGRRAEFEERVSRARKYLTSAPAITGDDRAMRVLGLFWAGATKGQLDDAVKTLIAHQNTDGGWSGNDHLATDAYTTAQSLCALSEVAKSGGAAYEHGVAYLLRNQRADGSWHVASRAVKFQPYFQSGFPFDHDQWISAAATAMAVTALGPVATRN